MALVYALHRERPPNDWGIQTAERCRNIWWTVYILDRAFSSSMGTPVSIHDDDITTTLPVVRSSNKSTALNIYVKLSRAVGRVLNRKCYCSR
jgi:proline utilization trans-activator